MSYVVEMLDIRKEFPGIVANDNITLTLKKRGNTCPIR
jgi:simple sugar transport system ATP-binding protein